MLNFALIVLFKFRVSYTAIIKQYRHWPHDKSTMSTILYRHMTNYFEFLDINTVGIIMLYYNLCKPYPVYSNIKRPDTLIKLGFFLSVNELYLDWIKLNFLLFFFFFFSFFSKHTYTGIFVMPLHDFRIKSGKEKQKKNIYYMTM